MTSTISSPLRLGLAGFGTVGSGLVHILEKNAANTFARTGRHIALTHILVRDVTRPRAVPLPEGAILTDSMDTLINNPDIDVIVEVMGGTGASRLLIEKALKAGKHVVTANKALLAEHGNDLFRLAAEKNLHLRYEASVCGGIPIIETLSNSLVANTISSLLGIMNGTSNYILSEMDHKGLSFDEALSMAQKKGYAEADPTFDIEGIDTAHKLSLLIRLAWGVELPFKNLPVRGIVEVKPADILFARTFGYRIKLLGHAKMHAGKLEAAVFPALVNEKALLSRVNDAYNAICVHGDAIGSVFLHGKGAGDLPTGSAVAADIFAIARSMKPNNTGFYQPLLPTPAIQISHDAIIGTFYIRIEVQDRPGVMRDVAAIMADNNISIAQAIQKKDPAALNGESVPFTIMTHKTQLVDIESAFKALKSSPFVSETPVYYRVLER